MNKKRLKEIDVEIDKHEGRIAELQKPIHSIRAKISSLEEERSRIEHGLKEGDIITDGKITVIVKGYSGGRYCNCPYGLFIKKDGTVGQRVVTIWSSDNWKKSDLKIKK